MYLNLKLLIINNLVSNNLNSMENNIRIENPCHENWNLMSRNQKGRFCDSCNKTVIDFSKM